MTPFRVVDGELEVEINCFSMVSTAVWKIQKLFPSSLKLQSLLYISFWGDLTKV